jgi:hypothetical protein
MERLEAFLLRSKSIQPKTNTATEVAAVGVHGPTVSDLKAQLVRQTIAIAGVTPNGLTIVGRVGMRRTQNSFAYEQGLHAHVVRVGHYLIELLLSLELDAVFVCLVRSDVKVLVVLVAPAHTPARERERDD